VNDVVFRFQGFDVVGPAFENAAVVNSLIR